MAFLENVLQRPSYGYTRHGELYHPTASEMAREFFGRLNVFADRKNWVQALCWFVSCSFAIPFVVFLFKYLTFTNFCIGFIYSMVILGTHGTIYYHRYGTHRAYQFTHKGWLYLVQNLVIRIIPEELYIVSHYVHHLLSEKPGDPYNVNSGWWSCFLADALTQPIAKDLSEKDYFRVTKTMDHTGIYMNTYKQYQKWGSVAHPGWTVLHFALNWAFWYGAFYLIGGHALAVTIFAASGFWAFGVRTFNFDGHGAGKDKRKAGIDFYREDHSINQLWPGLVTGEWHNNHHLFPNGVRAGFLKWQLDYAWYFIWFLSVIGAVKAMRDYKSQFLSEYYEPYLASLGKVTGPVVAPVVGPASTISPS